MIDAQDLRKRASWLLAVSARLPSRDVADMLACYADEMLERAESMELLTARQAGPPRPMFRPLPSPFPAVKRSFH